MVVRGALRVNQRQFENQYRQSWQQLDEWLASPKGATGGGRQDAIRANDLPKVRPALNSKALNPDLGLEFPERYRALCQQVSLAKQRRYNQELLSYLNDLALRAHHRFYRQAHIRHQSSWVRFVATAFPLAIYQSRRYVLWASLIFFLPLLITGLLCYHSETVIYSIMEPENVRHFEAIYSPRADKIGRERASDSDVMMFGFYIRNNIGVAFRTFAGGLIFGVGALLLLAFNSLFIGAIGGHVVKMGGAELFFGFVAGHSSFELMAIVLSGAAGFKLGDALLAPGRLGRVDALRAAAREAVPILYGVGLMLVLAAFIEAFWSSTASIPFWLKATVGLCFWVLVLLYMGSGAWLAAASRADRDGAG
jgi:uncharacterized membrane protein SpoIIM required for sporulation